MARSTKLMIPGTAFCLVGLVSQGLTLYVSAAKAKRFRLFRLKPNKQEKIAMHTDFKTTQRKAFLAALLALVVGLASLAVSWKNHADITELNAKQERLRQEKISADLDMLSKALFDSIHFVNREPRPVETDAEFRARTKQFADAMCEGFNRGYDEADKSNAKPEDIAIFQPMLIVCADKGKSPVN